MFRLNSVLIKKYCYGMLVILMIGLLSPVNVIGSLDVLDSDSITMSNVNKNDFDETLFKLTADTNQTLTFDLEELYHYVSDSYKDHLFLEAIDGFSTSMATYHALAVMRIFGLDYYKFGNSWQTEERAILEKLTKLLKKDDTPGFLLAESSVEPTVFGSFGVMSSLWLMREYISGIRSQAIDQVDFLINHSFSQLDSNLAGFKESYQNISLRATYQSLKIIQMLMDVVLNPDYYDNTITPYVNDSVTSFMINHSLQIYNFIDSCWNDADSFFDDSSLYGTPLEKTWYALMALELLNQSSPVPLPKTINHFNNSVTMWVQSLQKVTGSTKGGFGSGDEATLEETGIAIAILSMFNTLDTINRQAAINFIYSCQFLEQEGQDYTVEERKEFGGFSPNNLTHSNTKISKKITIHNAYYAAIGLLLSGDLANSTTVELTTSHYDENPGINNTGLIVQGKTGTITQTFTVYNYKSHGSLLLTSEIDNWNLTEGTYLETNGAFIGKSSASYAIKLENDSSQTYNWSLGTHYVKNQFTIRDLVVINSPVMTITSSVFVAYETDVELSTTSIKPGDNVSVDIMFQNISFTDYETFNVNEGAFSVILISPDDVQNTILSYQTVNVTSGENRLFIDFPNNSLLGTWLMDIEYNNSGFNFSFYYEFELEDTVILYNYTIGNSLYPGQDADINVSLMYSNGQITSKANATLVFKENNTGQEIFTLGLKYAEGNVYSAVTNKIPSRIVFGYYNVSVRLYWNKTVGYNEVLVENSSLPTVGIKGFPTITAVNLKSDYRDSITFSKDVNNTIYYGETINLTFNIELFSPLGSSLINNDSVNIKAEIINASDVNDVLQTLESRQVNETFIVWGIIDPNLPSDVYSIKLYAKSEWNNSFVELKDDENHSKALIFNISLIGSYEIENINYASVEESDGLPVYALDESLTLTITFTLVNTLDGNHIPVPGVALYALLNHLDKNDLNMSLPGISTATNTSTNEPFYILSIPLATMETGQYDISIYTTTSVSADSFLGELSPGFKIISSFNPKLPIELHEAVIIVLVVIFVVLGYLNFKRR